MIINSLVDLFCIGCSDYNPVYDADNEDYEPPIKVFNPIKHIVADVN